MRRVKRAHPPTPPPRAARSTRREQGRRFCARARAAGKGQGKGPRLRSPPAPPLLAAMAGKRKSAKNAAGARKARRADGGEVYKLCLKGADGTILEHVLDTEHSEHLVGRGQVLEESTNGWKLPNNTDVIPLIGKVSRVHLALVRSHTSTTGWAARNLSKVSSVTVRNPSYGGGTETSIAPGKDTAVELAEGAQIAVVPDGSVAIEVKFHGCSTKPVAPGLANSKRVEVQEFEDGVTGAWFPATIVRGYDAANVDPFATVTVEYDDLVADGEDPDDKDAVRLRIDMPLFARVEFNGAKRTLPCVRRELPERLQGRGVERVANERVEALVLDAWWSGIVTGMTGSDRRAKVKIQFDSFPFGAGDEGSFEPSDVRTHYVYNHEHDRWELAGGAIGGSKDMPVIVDAASIEEPGEASIEEPDNNGTTVS